MVAFAKKVRSLTQARKLAGITVITKEDPCRKATKRLSLLAQLQWWQDRIKEGRLTEDECRTDVNRLNKEIKRLGRITPSPTWHDDARGLTQDKGGAFPPPAEITPMVKARGELRYYPAEYITSSGHAYDIHLQRLYTGGNQHLLPDDGYMAARVTIYDLHNSDRKRLRAREKYIQNRGDYKAMTGMI